MRCGLQPIGVVISGYKTREEAPRQGLDREEASTLLFHEREAVERIKGRKRIRLLYWMHLADRTTLWSDKKGRGVFATRSPDRPNPIAVAVVDVLRTEGKKVQVRHLDAVEGTPILDAVPL